MSTSRPPTEDRPPTSGYTESADRLGSTAAPLLAGFAVSFLGLLPTSASSVRWPDPTLALVTLAAVLLMLSMQLFIVGRQYHLPYDEFATYTPDLDDALRRKAHAAADGAYRRWVVRSRLAFNVGLVVLVLGIAMALMPVKDSLTDQPGRLVAAGIALLACIAELAFIVAREWNAARWNRSIRSG